VIERALPADVEKWNAWHPAEAARLLASVRAPWYVAAGWAIDLFLGGQRREHEDLEIAVPGDRFGEVAEALAEFELFVPAREDDRDLVWPFAEAGERVRTHHQTWVREPATGLWRLDVFREPSAGDTWVCRRDESIRMPYAELIERTADGIPYARPEVVLLFKAKHSHEAKNESDLAATLPALAPARRERLARWLELVHPGHAWIDEVRGR
jgi:Aminoglycoside-2''-adenylyltransferase